MYIYAHKNVSLSGAFLSPALCIYVSDPFIWRYGVHATRSVKLAKWRHLEGVGAAATISMLTYYSLKLCGLDPQWTIKLVS